ncbi:T9SS type A sorting domain-containing protein [Methanococcoides sp. SA1]|uniref:T9SS type A sorting domain-containing protein n=1 Tax=unclassified Lentimicrobium TaxID=2677434 RepID=UPI0015521B34|nr:T9SS type A sorting domain-containing protein [Lentimicrobium sp. S6]NPD86934.1 T9SS type A sorting domain-containing protein [Lentimicrobium sp. L6]NPE30862.1 T9SS type A sorting domain-containing protein [Methanococcoides sp. SA1]
MIYKIYNQQGIYLFEGRLYQNKGINVNELLNGFYYIEVFDNNGRVFREKFIVKN